jgi:hypothetical protein
LVRLQCRLVSLQTSQIEKSAEVYLKDENQFDAAGRFLAGLLLSQLTQAFILDPNSESSCGRRLSLDGYASYLPSDWTLWITIQPEGNPRHFPQYRLTLQKDGSWYASDVYLGEETQKSSTATFQVYVILADRENTQKIDQYLVTHKSDGLDLNAWDKQGYRALHRIRIKRVSPMSGGCTLSGE